MEVLRKDQTKRTLGMTLKSWFTSFFFKESAAAEGPSCNDCGHEWGPHYVWLAAMIQVAPIPCACSAVRGSNAPCGCRTGGHFRFND